MLLMKSAVSIRANDTMRTMIYGGEYPGVIPFIRWMTLLQDLERDERILNRYLLRYYLKMRLDTPRDLRWALPSVATFVLPRLATIYGPGWLSRLRARLRLRTRWMEFRRWLRARFAVIDALLPLLWLATCTV